MSVDTIYSDITNLNDVDAIINPSNGVGFMGGYIGRFIELPGVAEAINYKTKGKIEKEAKKKCKKSLFLPKIIYGLNKGDVFVTTAGNLKNKYIIHAVTVKYPGFKSDMESIKILLPKIINICTEYKITSLAIPLLGTGVGGLAENDVLKIYDTFFKTYDLNNINIKIVLYEK